MTSLSELCRDCVCLYHVISHRQCEMCAVRCFVTNNVLSFQCDAAAAYQACRSRSGRHRHIEDAVDHGVKGEESQSQLVMLIISCDSPYRQG